MSDYDGQLAKACLDGIEPVLQSAHPQVYVEVLLSVVEAMGRSGERSASGVRREVYEGLRDRILNEQQKQVSPREIDKLLIGLDAYAVLKPANGDDILNWTSRADLPNDAAQSGKEILSAAIAAETGRVRRSMAHNHLLLFPEVMPLLCLFDVQQPKAVLKSRTDHFVFGRRLNDVTTTYIANECRDLKLIRPATADGDEVGYVLATTLPAPFIAYLVVKSYLAATDHQVDHGVPTEQIATRLALRGLQRDVLKQEDWQTRLRPGGEGVVRFGVGGSEMRITGDDLLWLATRRLIDPTDVGRVLVRRRAKAAVATVRDSLQRRMKSFAAAPVNMREYLDAFE